MKMVGTALAGRVVEHNGQIRGSSSFQAFFNLIPTGKPVTETDNRKIMCKRRAKKRGAAAGGGQSGNNLHLRTDAFTSEFIDQRRHPIDSAVTGTNHRDIFPLVRHINRHLTALGFLRHRRGQKLLIRIALPDQIHIDMIADNDIAGLQRTICPDCHVFVVAGANTHNDHFTQSAPPKFLPQLRLSRHVRQFSLQSVFLRLSTQLVHKHYLHLSCFVQTLTA